MEIQNQQRYKCPECGLEYLEKKWAEECQKWCAKYKSCNLEITSHAIKPVDMANKERS
jgi:transposase-like protein